MLKTSNRVVKNAFGEDAAGAAAFLAGFEMSKRIRKENEERKNKAKGSVTHAMRDLNGALNLFDSVAKSGDPIASQACQSISQSLSLLARLFSR